MERRFGVAPARRELAFFWGRSGGKGTPVAV
jgi:hypothetical protein